MNQALDTFWHVYGEIEFIGNADDVDAFIEGVDCAYRVLRICARMLDGDADDLDLEEVMNRFKEAMEGA